MSSSGLPDPVGSPTRAGAGVKRKREDEGPGQIKLCRGAHLIPALDRMNGRVEAFQANAERMEPSEVVKRIQVKVTRIRLMEAEETIRQLQRELAGIRQRLVNLIARLQVN